MTTRRLWTAICDYRGGTYVRQTRAGNAARALVEVVASLSPREVTGLSERAHRDLVSQSPLEDLGAVEGMENVWCASLLADDDALLLVHLVETKPK